MNKKVAAIAMAFSLVTATIQVTATEVYAKNNEQQNMEVSSGVESVLGNYLSDYSIDTLIKTDVDSYISTGMLSSKAREASNTTAKVAKISYKVTSGISDVLGSHLDIACIADVEAMDVNISTLSEDEDVPLTEEPEEEDEEDIDTSDQTEQYRLNPYNEGKVRYVKCQKLNGRSTPDKSPTYGDNIVEVYKWNTKITIYGQIEYTEWVYTFDEKTGHMIYIDRNYLSSKKQHKPKKKVHKRTSILSNWNGKRLNRRNGRVNGPSGPETYYNLPMQGVINIMRRMGNNDPYWIRADGVKMLGQYVMVAADLRVHPRGSHIPTSLGMGVVCDTGTFIYQRQGIDVSVNW